MENIQKRHILYSAVVLDEKSHDKLYNYLKTLIPKDWTVYCHHMTINLGAIKPEYERYVGTKVRITVDGFGIGEKVSAVKCSVNGIQSTNQISHITVAVDVNTGGKPSMSNQITRWFDIKRPLSLTGVVTEIEAN